MRLVRLLAVLLVAATAAGSAWAQSWPTKPVRVVVTFPPGGTPDIYGRIMSVELSKIWNQAVIVENRTGASGTIGTEAVAKAAPDGYTLLFAADASITIAPNVYAKLGYDPTRDLTAIVNVAAGPFVLLAHPSFPANNVKELIALLKANPGKYSFASSGSGATSHLMSVLFNSMAGVNVVHVPYKGSSQSITDVVSGQIAYTIETVPAVAGLVKAGKLRALGATSLTRAVAMPEVPTIAETLPGYEMFGWIGLMAPAGTPGAITDRISAETQKIMQDPEIRKRFLAAGMEPAGNTPAQFHDFLMKQNDRYGSIVKQAHVKLD